MLLAEIYFPSWFKRGSKRFALCIVILMNFIQFNGFYAQDQGTVIYTMYDGFKKTQNIVSPKVFSFNLPKNEMHIIALDTNLLQLKGLKNPSLKDWVKFGDVEQYAIIYRSVNNKQSSKIPTGNQKGTNPFDSEIVGDLQSPKLGAVEDYGVFELPFVQEEKPQMIDPTEPTETFVEEEAEFPGGHAAMGKFINDNIDYPQEAIDLGIKGRVTVRFVVEKDGRVSNVSVAGALAGCKACDKAAVQVVEKMPAWKTGKNGGRSVRTLVTLPIKFEVDSEPEPIEKFVDEEAEFPGGYEAIVEYINGRITYAKVFLDRSIKGRVQLHFVVEKDGRVSNVSVVTPSAGGKAFYNAAIQMVEEMPAWKPGKIGGRSVRSWVNLWIGIKGKKIKVE